MNPYDIGNNNQLELIGFPTYDCLVPSFRGIRMPFNPAAPLIPLWLTVFGFSLLLAAVQLIHPVRRLLPLQSRVTLVLVLSTVSLPASGAATGLPLLSDGRL